MKIVETVPEEYKPTRQKISQAFRTLEKDGMVKRYTLAKYDNTGLTWVLTEKGKEYLKRQGLV